MSAFLAIMLSVVIGSVLMSSEVKAEEYFECYYDDYDTGVNYYDANPQNMVDGSTSTTAQTEEEEDSETFTSNSCIPSEEFLAKGYVITKVEFNMTAYDDCDKAYGFLSFRPEFSGGYGDVHTWNTIGILYTWAWQDITSDTNAPDPWTWDDLEDMLGYVAWKSDQECQSRVSQIGIRATYEMPATSTEFIENTTTGAFFWANKNISYGDLLISSLFF